MNKRFMLFASCLILFIIVGVADVAAQIRITGRVTDKTNEGLPGVNVQVTGTTTGTITDIDGNYVLSVASKRVTLRFSFVGYKTLNVPLAGKSTLNVKMEEDSETLDEVVVVAYGTQRKQDLTGAIQTIKPNENDASTSNSLSSLLNGKVAGLVVSSPSSTPGAASSVVIRGASSLRGDNQPLYVIDNVPQASTGEFASSAVGSGDFQVAQDPLSSINPNDIENITVLKDASSTAIYGSRGANGVILITTKSGKAGKTKISASANFTIAEPTRLLQLINLQQFGDYVNSRNMDPKNNQFHYVDGQMRYVFQDATGQYDANNPLTYKIIEEHNWQKEIYASSLSQNYSVSLNGGSENMTYYVSANYKDINGMIKQTGFKQGDLLANLNVKLSPRLKFKLSMSGNLRQNNLTAGGNSLGGSTTAISSTAIQRGPFEMPEDDPAFNNENKTTIFSWLNDYVDRANDRTFKASGNIEWLILPDFTYSLRVGGNLNTNDRDRWYGLQLYLGMNNQGLLANSATSKSNYTVENLLTYKRKLSETIHFDAMSGVTYDSYKSLNKNTKGTNFSFFSLREKGMAMAQNLLVSTPEQNDYQLLSYLGKVNFSFYEKYLLSATFRADGSSKFAKSHRWGYFPSVSAAWRIEQESFLKKIDWLSQLKLRLTYGVTGNQSISPYSTFSSYGNSGVIYSDGKGSQDITMTITNLSNNDLTWEKTTSWNAGLDFSFLRSRLSGSLDFYKKKTTDLLISRPLPGSASFASTYYNEGGLDNIGFEATLFAQLISSKKFSWSISGNFAKNTSKITGLGLLPGSFGSLGQQVGYLGRSIGDHFGTANIFLEGHAPGLFYGYQTNGIVQTEDVTPDGAKYTKRDGTEGIYKFGSILPQAGDIKFVDVNEDGIVDANDLTLIGDPNPDFTYGFATEVSFRQFKLSAQFNGVYGRDILNTGIRYNQLPGRRSAVLLSNVYEQMWTPERPSNLYTGSNYEVQNVVMDRYIEDASYLRCSNITLNYQLPAKWSKTIGLSNISCFATVSNAFILTNYSGYDPEVNSFAFDGLRPGIDTNSYPNPRTYVFGLNVSF